MAIGRVAVDRRTDDDEDDDECSDVPPPPPDGGWGWMVVFGSFMIHFITDGLTYSFGKYYDEFMAYFQAGESSTSWIASTLVGVTLCSGPISSSFVNKYGCRPVTIAGSILAAACILASFWAPNVPTLIVTIGIGTGFGFGLIYLPAIVSVTMYFEKRRSLATGIAVCGSGLGNVVFIPIIKALLDEYGWRGSFFIMAGVVLQCAIFGAFFRPLPPEERSPSRGDRSLRKTAAMIDIHVSHHDLGRAAGARENGGMHRPHSIGHVCSIPRGGRLELNGNVATEKPAKSDGNDAARLALSQPMLTQSEGNYRHHQHYGSQNLRRLGPLDRPDALYQGSLMNIPSYRSRTDLKRGEDGAALARRRSSFGQRRRRREERTTVCGVVPCSRETKETLAEMLDMSLFKDLVFVIFLASNFLTSIGYNVPYVYAITNAKELGFGEGDTLLPIIGAANTIGRIVLGYVSDKPWINRFHIYICCLTLCGVSVFISAFCTTFYSLAIYYVVFGFTIGAYVGLTSVILVDLLGIEKLTNAFGLLLLFQGLASLIGPPIGGALRERYGTYRITFCMAGLMVALSGLILYAIPPISRWQKKRARDLELSSTDI